RAISAQPRFLAELRQKSHSVVNQSVRDVGATGAASRFAKGTFMRQKSTLLLLSGVALAMALSFASAPNAATPEGEPKEESVTFEPAQVQSFAGAFLAGRTADVDHDYPTAITLYAKALEFDPANLEIRERLMISYLLNGDFDEGLAEAEALKEDAAVERITTIVRGLDAIRDGRFDEAKTLLDYSGPNDLDRLTHELISAWADVGAGNGKQAIEDIGNTKGPEWFKVFTDYH